jgi:hypothetical protein
MIDNTKQSAAVPCMAFGRIVGNVMGYPLSIQLDDDVIVAELRKRGHWAKVRAEIRMGRSWVLADPTDQGFDAFVWFGQPGDSGFAHYHLAGAAPMSPATLALLCSLRRTVKIVDSSAYFEKGGGGNDGASVCDWPRVEALLAESSRVLRSGDAARFNAVLTELRKAAAPPARKLEAVDAADWIETDPPPLDPIIEEMFEGTDKVALIGSPKLRKSFLALQLALEVAFSVVVARASPQSEQAPLVPTRESSPVPTGGPTLDEHSIFGDYGAHGLH